MADRSARCPDCMGAQAVTVRRFGDETETVLVTHTVKSIQGPRTTIEMCPGSGKRVEGS
jgi:hypothetical protein